MNRQRAFALVELATGLGMLAGFVLVLAGPAATRLAVDLVWLLHSPPSLPRFGINPHWVAEAQHVPSLAVLAGCAAVAVCYRWISSRRRE